VIATCDGKPAQNWTLPLSNREVALGTGGGGGGGVGGG
jgi:hypothetical protein